MSENRTRRIVRCLFVVAVGVTLALGGVACGGAGSSPTPEPAPTATPLPTQTAPPPPVAPVAAEGVVGLMWAASDTFQMEPGNVQEAVNLFQDSLAWVLQGQPGCNSVLLLSNADTGEVILQTVWAGQEELKAAQANLEVEGAMAALADLATAPPKTRHLQVSVAHVTPESSTRAWTEALVFQPGNLAEAVRTFQGGVLPALQEQTGFAEAYLLTDPGTGEALVESLWASQDDLDVAVASDELQKQFALLHELGGAAEGITQEMWASTNIKR